MENSGKSERTANPAFRRANIHDYLGRFTDGRNRRPPVHPTERGERTETQFGSMKNATFILERKPTGWHVLVIAQSKHKYVGPFSSKRQAGAWRHIAEEANR